MAQCPRQHTTDHSWSRHGKSDTWGTLRDVLHLNGRIGGTSMSQMVQVVSMLDVPRRFGSVSFQSNDVSGAQNSLFLFCAAPSGGFGASRPQL